MFNILVINSGSSSLKFQVIEIESGELLAKGLCERIGIDGAFTYENVRDGLDKDKKEVAIPDHRKAIELTIEALTDGSKGVLKSLSEINAVGHRVAHGGELFDGSVVVTEDVIKRLSTISDLAPLHNPANLAGVASCQELMPGVPNVLTFDTAFHQTMPPKAYMYAIPRKYYRDYKIRRYGFHGTSHHYVAQTIADHLNKKLESLKVIVCHLGNGASITAIRDGKSVDTSMGFTPAGGLIMGTRCGDVDPSVFNYIIKKEGISGEQADSIVNKESGVLALSGVSSDFRDLWEAKDKGNEDAAVALDAFIYKVAKTIGSYVAAMNGVDIICFTAGIGENDIRTRAEVLSYFGYLGITCDAERNNVRGELKEISTPDSKVRCFVVPTNEELRIAKDTYALVKK